jgi:hypothetical protein
MEIASPPAAARNDRDGKQLRQFQVKESFMSIYR